jgi:hypothetical protein
VLHRFVSLANEPDFLRLGWMRERPSGRPSALGRRVRRLVRRAECPLIRPFPPQRPGSIPRSL